MPPRHVQRIASRMKFLVSHVIQRELSDPRLGFVTVLGVEPTYDLREAKVRVSVLGTKGERSTSMRALEDARGYVQRRVGKALEIRHTPVLRFVLEQPTGDAIERIESILEKTRSGEEIELADDDEAGADDGEAGADDGVSR